MTVRCPSCSASLRVNEDRLGGRTTAKCPRCQTSVPLVPESPGAKGSNVAAAPTAAAGTILVSCASCGARLKAPASRAGTTSACPKCHAQVTIQPPARAAVAAAAGGAAGGAHEESSSAATRRIDSRMLGRIGPPGEPPPSGGVDLDAFVRPAASAAHETPAGAKPLEPGDPQGLAASLLQPPVGKMEKIAEEIRDTAEKLTESPAPTRPRSSAASPGHPHASSGPQTAHAPRGTEKPARVEPAPHVERPGQTAPASGSRLTALRGLLSGGLAGALIGGAAAGAVASGQAAGFIAPLPIPDGIIPVSDAVLRVLVPCALGALSGFIAAALSSERARGGAILLRCAGMGLLMGTACGLVGGVATGTGLLVWPIAHWMRDLLLVGLLTPALNRILPAASSR